MPHEIGFGNHSFGHRWLTLLAGLLEDRVKEAIGHISLLSWASALTHVPFFFSFVKTCRLSVWYSLFFLKWMDVFHTQPEKNSIFSISLSIPLLYDNLFAGNISQFSKTVIKHFHFWSEGFWRPFCQNRSDIDFDGLVVGIFQGLSNMFLHRIAMKFGFSLILLRSNYWLYGQTMHSND